MENNIGVKFICIKDIKVVDDDDENLWHQFKIGDIIEIKEYDAERHYPYITDNDIPLLEKELLEHFITIAQLRDKRIDEILND